MVETIERPTTTDERPAAESTVTFVAAINESLREAMREDDTVVVLGEDVGVRGGVFRATAGLLDEFGEDRVIDTPLVHAAYGESYDPVAIGAGYPIGRVGRPEEVAAAVVWLCRDAASLVTGVALPVDGGFLA